MASTETPKDASRRWNLGKEAPVPEKKPVEKPAPDPIAPPPIAPKPVAAKEPVTTSSEVSSSMPVPGRPVPPPRSFRETLNHPLTLTVVGLVLSAIVFYNLFRGRGTAEATSAPASSGEFVSSYIAQKPEAVGSSQAVEKSIESPEMQDARLLLATGQILEAIGGIRTRQMTETIGADAYQFVPPAMVEAPLPGGTELEQREAQLRRELAAEQVLALGAAAMAKAMQLGLKGEEVMGVATRLSTEGLSIIEKNGEEALAKMPAARGAANRLSLIQKAHSDAQISEMLRQLFEPAFADSVIAARQRRLEPAKGSVPKP